MPYRMLAVKDDYQGKKFEAALNSAIAAGGSRAEDCRICMLPGNKDKAMFFQLMVMPEKPKKKPVKRSSKKTGK